MLGPAKLHTHIEKIYRFLESDRVGGTVQGLDLAEEGTWGSANEKPGFGLIEELPHSFDSLRTPKIPLLPSNRVIG